MSYLTLSGEHRSGKSYELCRIAIREAEQGHTVVYQCHSHDLLRCRFDDLKELARQSAGLLRIDLANGNEEIRFENGGRIRMITTRGIRGFSNFDMHLMDDVPYDGESDIPCGKRVIRTTLEKADL